MVTTIPTRRFGRAEQEISAIGLGGYHLGKPRNPEVAYEIVHRAILDGITFMDNCWDYHDGESERRMGHALRQGYRERAFLMTKLDSRSRDGVMRQFEQSLERLDTGYVDLLQAHEVIRAEDVDQFLAPGAGLDAFIELRDQGAVRYIGFTGHKDPDIHLAMLNGALARDFVFDAVQMPINPFDAQYRSFLEQVVPVCEEHGIAVLGMKPLGSGNLVGHGGLGAPDLLRWAMTQPVATVITGCESLDDLEQAITTATEYAPYSEDELEQIARAVAAEAVDGSLEAYKTTDEHDGTSGNPQWLA